MAENRNPAIICCRTVSMILVVLCHVIRNYTFVPGHDFLGQVMNVGVYSFLAISGYLYGSKTVENFSVWFRKRYLTVILPTSIVIVLTITVETLIGNKPSWFTALIYLLNLQGLTFFVPDFCKYFPEITVLGPLWFITVIMLCYSLVPFLQKYRERFFSGRYGYAIILCAMLICFVLALGTGLVFAHFLTFAIGYFLSAKKVIQPIQMSGFFWFTLVMLGAQVLRLYLLTVCDGTDIYQNYTYISHMILGLWILCFFLAFNDRFPRIINWLAMQKVFSAGNDISFYVYLTHNFFCCGRLNVYKLFDNLLLSTLAFLMATVLTALVLKKITEKVQQILAARF